MLDAGVKPAKICAQLDVSSNQVYKVKRLKERGEDLTPKYGGGRPPKRTLPLLRIVKDMYKADPMVSHDWSLPGFATITNLADEASSQGASRGHIPKCCAGWSSKLLCDCCDL